MLRITAISHFLQLTEKILKSTRCSLAVGFSEEACLKLELKDGEIFSESHIYDEFDSYTSMSLERTEYK